MTGLAETRCVAGGAAWPPDRFRSMIDNLKEVVFQTDTKGRWTYLNRAWEEITGFSVGESLGVAFPEFVYPEDREDDLERFRLLIGHKKESCRHEVRYLAKGGGFRWMEVHARLTLDEAGRILGASGTLSDVTERRRANDESRDARERLEFVLASNPAVIFAGRPGTNGAPWECTYMSDSVRAVLGFTPEAFTADPGFWLTTIHPDDLPEVYRSFSEMAALGRSTCRCRSRRGDGSYRWLRNDTRVVADSSGRPVETFGCLVDETRTRETEESLRSHAAILDAVCLAARRFLDAPSWRKEVGAVLGRLGLAAGASRVYVVENVGGAGGDTLSSLRYEWDAEGVPQLLGNPRLECVSYRELGVARWVEVLGRGEPIHGRVRDFPASEKTKLPPRDALSLLLAPIFTGRDWWGFIGFDDCAAEREWSRAGTEALRAAAGILGAAIKREQTESALLRSHSELEARVAERTEDLGRLNERLRAEVTERRAAQQALADREARFRTLIENTSDVIFVVNAEAALEYVSPTVTRVLGYDPSELIGRSGLGFIHPRDAQRVADRHRDGLSVGGSHAPLEFQVRRQDGSYRTFEAVGNNQLENPAVRGVVITLRDITDRRRLEEQFRQAQKMEALGRLAGGVAHDFNNLLTVICGYSELLVKRMREEDPLRRNAGQIKRAADRATALVQQLLAFSRTEAVEPAVLDVNQAIADLDKMLQRLIGEDIELTIAPAPDPLNVQMDRTQFEQIVMNLSVNARDAMPNGGALAISTGPHSARGTPDCRGCKVALGDFAVLEVQDTGCGMSEETKAHITAVRL